MRTMLKDLDELEVMVKQDDSKEMKGAISETTAFIKE